MIEMKLFVSRVKNLLAANKLKEVMAILKKSLKEGELSDELILVSNKIKVLEKEARMETLSEAEVAVRRNKIIFEVLGILNNLRPEDISVEELKEAESTEGEINKRISSQVINNQGANIGNQINVNKTGNDDFISRFFNEKGQKMK